MAPEKDDFTTETKNRNNRIRAWTRAVAQIGAITNNRQHNEGNCMQHRIEKQNKRE